MRQARVMQLAHFDVDSFLAEYWQKKPLLIRNPWADWHSPVEPDELAGLACEEGVEARIVVRESKRWSAEHGPFAPDRFVRLGKNPWTLLVQAVDHHVPEVAALLDPFRFVPNWRIDDVMVSYASDGGGVGPHFDQYDVFLIQGLGRRKWQIGGACDASNPLISHDDLRLLADFQPTDEWVLEPGDILYVPPGIAHNGVAVGDDCMTYSIGFRAPARSELIAHWTDHVLADLVDDDRYRDAVLEVTDNPGEISSAALTALQAMVVESLSDRNAFARWFGEYNTAPKYPEVDWTLAEPATLSQLRQWLAGGEALCRNPASRFSFTRREGGGVVLFVDGESFDCHGAAADFAQQLCAHNMLEIKEEWLKSGDCAELMLTLYNGGRTALKWG